MTLYIQIIVVSQVTATENC